LSTRQPTLRKENTTMKPNHQLISTGIAAALAAGSAMLATPTAASAHSPQRSDPCPAADTVPVCEINQQSTQAPDTAAVEILSPDEPWAGLTRGEWDARGWQWSLSLPPDFDASGGRCGYGQVEPVFFLPGSSQAEITCAVAEGTAIFVKLAGVECSTVEPEPYFGRTEDELRACAIAALDGDLLDFQARINGHEVADLDTYQSVSPLFTITFAKGNRFEVSPAVGQSVAAAYSFIIAPPPPGEYEIVMSTTYVGEPQPFVDTVNLIVDAVHVVEPPQT
jgi:hypothetical protein